MSELITNISYITKFFSALTEYEKIPCIINGKKIFIGELRFLKDDSSINFIPKNFSFKLPSKPIGFKFIFKGTIYSFISEVMTFDESNSIYTIRSPQKLNTNFKRMLSRYTVKETDSISLIIHGFAEEFKIKNINTNGLAFVSNKRIFKKINISKSAELIINNKKKLAVNLKVKYISIQKTDSSISYVYGVEFKEIEWIQFYDLFSFIFANEFPNLKHMYEFEKEDIYILFKNTGYFAANINISKDNLFKDMYENIIRLSFFPQLSCNLIYFDKKLICSSSVSRIYEDTFLNHQFLSSTSKNIEPKHMYMLFKGINEFLINNPYYKYYLNYIDNDLDWNRNLYVNAAKYINNFENFRLDTIAIYSYKIETTVIDGKAIDTNKQEYTGSLTLTEESSITKFISFCSKNLSKLECEVFSYNEKFSLKSLKDTYKLMGLKLERCLYSIKENDEVISYVVFESYPILNIINLIDNCIIYPTKKDFNLKELLTLIIAELTSKFIGLNKNNFFIFALNPETYNCEINFSLKNLNGPFIDLRIIGDKLSTKEYCDYLELLLE